MFCPFIEQLLCARPDVGRWHACSHLTLLWAVGRKGPLYISILQGRKLRPGDEVICLWGPMAISKWSWEILKWLRQKHRRFECLQRPISLAWERTSEALLSWHLLISVS